MLRKSKKRCEKSNRSCAKRRQSCEYLKSCANGSECCANPKNVARNRIEVAQSIVKVASPRKVAQTGVNVAHLIRVVPSSLIYIFFCVKYLLGPEPCASKSILLSMREAAYFDSTPQNLRNSLFVISFLISEK